MKYSISEEYAEIAEEVISEVPELQYLRTADCRIAYLGSVKKKLKGKKSILGECMKVQEIYKTYTP